MSIENINSLDYVILLCDDLAGMRKFYRGLPGFEMLEDREDWVKFRLGGSFLTLRPRGRWYDGKREGSGASVQLAFRLTPAGVDQAHRQLLKKSVEILEPPTDQAFGHRTLYFRDPEGNILEIYAEI